MQLGDIKAAVKELDNSGVVGMPTETVYGLAAKISDPVAINKIFSTKRRPFFDPLIVHVASIAMAKQLTTDWSLMAEGLAEKFWPGPLTLILPKADLVNPLITSGLDSVGIRMPSHPMALELIEKAKVALAAPSANRFGKTSPTKASHVLSEFPADEGIVIDGGDCEVGLESTVLLIKRNNENYQLSILRAGAVSESAISQLLHKKGFKFSFVEKINKQLAPGQMKHHYMPEIPLVVVKDAKLSIQQILLKAEQAIAQMPDQIDDVEIKKPAKFVTVTEIPLADSPHLAARKFYADLREYSEKSKADILVIRISSFHNEEAWQPLLDRLTKAASLIISE